MTGTDPCPRTSGRQVVADKYSGVSNEPEFSWTTVPSKVDVGSWVGVSLSTLRLGTPEVTRVTWSRGLRILSVPP